MALEKAGGACHAYAEIDANARRSYERIYGLDECERVVAGTRIDYMKDGRVLETGYTDIKEVSTDDWQEYRGAVELISGGFPCQAFSLSGKRRGFQDTRGTLFFEIARAAREVQPRFLLLENVTGLLSHDGGCTFYTLLAALDELGYDAEWQVLNSAFFTAQSRERVYIIGHRRGESTRAVFPLTPKGRDIDESRDAIGSYPLDGRVSIQHAVPATVHETKIKSAGNFEVGRVFTAPQRSRIVDPTGLSPTIDTTTPPHIHLGRQIRGMLDLTKIRKVTPLECWRLQGFPDWAYEKAATVSSTSALYKQAGNSVTVPVIYYLARKLVEAGL
jgi:DNA (cytosine-5)-methyltransferase 1